MLIDPITELTAYQEQPNGKEVHSLPPDLYHSRGEEQARLWNLEESLDVPPADTQENDNNKSLKGDEIICGQAIYHSETCYSCYMSLSPVLHPVVDSDVQINVLSVTFHFTMTFMARCNCLCFSLYTSLYVMLLYHTKQKHTDNSYVIVVSFY